MELALFELVGDAVAVGADVAATTSCLERVIALAG